jgi:hypothetical protein
MPRHLQWTFSRSPSSPTTPPWCHTELRWRKLIFSSPVAAFGESSCFVDGRRFGKYDFAACVYLFGHEAISGLQALEEHAFVVV